MTHPVVVMGIGGALTIMRKDGRVQIAIVGPKGGVRATVSVNENSFVDAMEDAALINSER